MKNHILESNMHKCDVCDADFQSSEELTNHKLTHREDEAPEPVQNGVGGDRSSDECTGTAKQYFCTDCGGAFATPLTLSRHRNEAHDKDAKHKEASAKHKAFACKICGHTSEVKHELKRHLRTVHFPQMWKLMCSVCEKKFPSSAALQRHMSEKHGVSAEQGSSSLYPTDKGKGTFTCDICGGTFDQRSDLLYHKRRHREEGPYLCHICDKAFKTMKELTEHRSTHPEFTDPHLSPPKQIAPRKKRVAAGQNSNPRNKPFVCEECGQGFTLGNSLKRHVQIIHRNIRPLKCDVCGKRWGRLDDFKNHKLTHMAQHAREERRKKWKEESRDPNKQFVCEECEQGFTTANSLKRHVQIIHRNIKPFKCDVCGKCYGRIDELKNHKLSHRPQYASAASQQFWEKYGHLNTATGAS